MVAELEPNPYLHAFRLRSPASRQVAEFDQVGKQQRGPGPAAPAGPWAIDVLTALAPSLQEAVSTCVSKAFVILDAPSCRSTASPPTGPTTRASTRSMG